MMPPQGQLSIARMCALTAVSRASYYRYWHQTTPRREETALRDVLQRLAVAHRHYGYRRLTALVRREGWAANHKRILRLMRTDNLLCVARHEKAREFGPAATSALRGGPRRLSLGLGDPASVAVPFNREDLGVVDEAIDERDRTAGVREDGRPVAEGQVGGYSVESLVKLLVFGEAG